MAAILDAMVDFGAVGNGIADDTLALQAALDAHASTGLPLRIPKGTYITDTLTYTGISMNVYGDGKDQTVLQAKTTSSNGLVCTGSNYLRGTLHDMRLQGIGGTTGRGFAYQRPAEMYDFQMTNMYILGWGGDCVYIPGIKEADTYKCVFSTTFDNVAVGDGNGHGFYVDCGPAVTFINCYARTMATDKVGYWIIAGQPTFIGCNGLNSGDVMIRLGISYDLDDQVRFNARVYWATASIMGTNFENCSVAGLQIRKGSSAILSGCSFAMNSASHECSAIEVEDGLSDLNSLSKCVVDPVTRFYDVHHPVSNWGGVLNDPPSNGTQSSFASWPPVSGNVWFMDDMFAAGNASAYREISVTAMPTADPATGAWQKGDVAVLTGNEATRIRGIRWLAPYTLYGWKRLTNSTGSNFRLKIDWVEIRQPVNR